MSVPLTVIFFMLSSLIGCITLSLTLGFFKFFQKALKNPNNIPFWVLNVQEGSAWKKESALAQITLKIKNKKKEKEIHTLSQAASRQGLLGRAEAQLSTHHGGRQQAPVVVTYGAPLSVFQHLHSALAYDGPTAETDQRLLKTRGEKKNGGTVKPHFSENNRLSWKFGPWTARRKLRRQTGWLHVYRTCC